jgi:hypothetical protein
MRDAFALVIGVDTYHASDIPNLPGCVDDALQAVTWLLKIGVPADRIFLHIESEVSAPGGVVARKAKRDDIWDSMLKLSRQGASQFFVFMSGHGLHTGRDGPIFLTADYSTERTSQNLGVDEHLRWFRSWAFRDQYVFYDACQNMIVATGQVSPVRVRLPDIASDAYTPSIENAQTVCWSASASQRALAGNGRGVMMRKILDQLDPDALAALPPEAQQQDAIIYNWATGERGVHLKPLFDNLVAPDIEAEAAAGDILQTPRCHQFDRALDVPPPIILALPPEPTVKLTVSVTPNIALPAVLQLKLTTMSPNRSHYRPGPRNPLVQGFTCQAPKGASLTAFCTPKPNTPWLSTNSPVSMQLDQDTDLVLQLDRPVDPPPATGDNAFNLRVFDPENPLGALDIANLQHIVTPRKPLPGVTFDFGVMGVDIGFDTEIEGGIANAQAVVGRVLKSMRRQFASQGLHVLVAPPGTSAQALRPNLDFAFGAEGPGGLGGYLVEASLVTITSADGGDFIQRFSLSDIAHHPVERLDPGAYRLEIDLPWGRWTRRFVISAEPFTLRLPDKIGLEPVRNAWLREGPRSSRIIRMSGDPYFGGAGRSVPNGRDGDPYTFLTVGTFDIDVLSEVLPARTRVEPLSETGLPEWDMIFSAGRLDAITDARLAELVHADPGRHVPEPKAQPLLMLGLAYAAEARGDQEGLLTALRYLERAPRTIDQQLLSATLGARGPRVVDLDDLQRHFAYMPGIPALKWGVELIRELFADQPQQIPAWALQVDEASAWALVEREPRTAPTDPDFDYLDMASLSDLDSDMTPFAPLRRGGPGADEADEE